MGKVIIGGAGLAGLACALQTTAAGIETVVLESAGHAGGRARSFYDTTLGTTIDNGNHLLLSGNWAALSFLADVGASDRLTGPARTTFPFCDVASGERWTVMPSQGLFPWWIFQPHARVAGTGVLDYISLVKLLLTQRGRAMRDAIRTDGALYERFWDPFIVAVLNTPTPDAAAELVTPVLRETFAKGASACRPLISREGLSHSFADPACAALGERGALIEFNQRISSVETTGDSVSQLKTAAGEWPLGAGDAAVMSMPAQVAGTLLPSITVPNAFSAIVNLHFRVDEPVTLLDDNHFMGLVNSTGQWLFRRGDIVSATISAADALAKLPADQIIERVWRDVATALELSSTKPAACQVIKERRATFLQTPAQVARRPGTKTAIGNLFLAGDWTDTGVPATIEGAIRSGYKAADAVIEHMG